MNLSWIDWAIVIVAIVALRLISLRTQQHMKGVADFLSANRKAGRYLLTIAGQMGGFGAISFVALFEMHYEAGFTPIWWGLMSIPVGVIVLLTGWIFYRFRETRALTMAQFFEMRYSRRFRILAGCLCWISGVLNFGIFPAVAARFFIYFCGLPDYFLIPGLHIQLSTFASVMLLDLGLALIFVLKGGQIAVMITECAQGIFACIAFVVISAVVLLTLQWSTITGALSTAPANTSMLNPFQTSQVEDFNVWYFLIAVFGMFYGYMSWQGVSGFYSSARSPHEQRMGGIIGIWREVPKVLTVLLLSIAGYTLLNTPEYAAKAAVVNDAIDGISNPAIQNQMRVPIALAHFLPIGIKGILATVILFFSFTCHDTYMHSWGSIFVQDVIMPLRKKALEPDQHIKLLRWSIIGVAIFAFFFSLLYPQTQKILMFQVITGTIWLGGSGIVIIGGLYWKRGTTAAAYCALILGAVLGVAGLIVPELYKNHYGCNFPVNGQWLWLFGMVSAMIMYVVVSLLTGSKEKLFNLEKMLGRGKYKRADSHTTVEQMPQSKWLQLVGIREEFSKADRILAVALVVWNMGWFSFFSVVSAINLLFGIGTDWWAKFWHFYVWAYLLLSVPITIWFTVGGVIDIKALFVVLGSTVRDHTDDGRVVHEPKECVDSNDIPNEVASDPVGANSNAKSMVQ
ncbi:MAG: sodium:solute symporter family protein [Armatimonadota bacterium]